MRKVIPGRRTRNEEGQVLVLFALTLVVMLGFVALAVDVGFFLHTKREAQNDADAMALAGVRELSERGLTSSQREAAALAVAQSWGTLNGVSASELSSAQITSGTNCAGDVVADTLTVRLARPQTTLFANILGISSATMNVCSTARTGMAKGGPGLLPLGVLHDNPGISGVCFYAGNTSFWYDPDDGLDFTYAEGGVDEQCTIKVARPASNGTWAPGQTGPIRLDDPSNDVNPANYDADCENEDNSGAAGYAENIVEGSECAYAVDDWIKPLPGAQVGQTCSNFKTLLSGHLTSDVHADHDIEDVFKNPTLVNGEYVYELVDTTNPHFGLLPVVTTPAGGASIDVRVITFVTVYIVGCGATGTGANEIHTVTLIPVNSQYFAAGQEIVEPGAPNYTSDWPAYTIKLTN